MTSRLGILRLRLDLRLASLVAFVSLFFAVPAKAHDLDDLSFDELSHYVQYEANRFQIALLAQRQFYFEVSRNHAEQAEDYLHLQEAIAERIPNEFSRPVFDVRFIFGDKSAVRKQSTIGILGGTGPISDASISSLIMARVNPGALPNGTMIHLFSLPPPRTTKETLLGGALYGARLATFMRHGYLEYYLASNTAHMNRGSLEILSGPGKIVNLPEIIAEKVAADQLSRGSRESILILGTTAAAEGRLYGSIFDKKQMAYAEIRADHQSTLQGWIDTIKKGLLTPDGAKQLKAFVSMLANEYHAKDILLSCTELPLGLGASMDELVSAGNFIYDTEKMMADIIAERLADY